MTLITGRAKEGDGWIGDRLDPDWEEEQRELATLVQVKVLDENYPVRVVVQRQLPDGTWFDTSTDLELEYDESTEQMVDGRSLPQRLLVSEVRT